MPNLTERTEPAQPRRLPPPYTAPAPPPPSRLPPPAPAMEVTAKPPEPVPPAAATGRQPREWSLTPSEIMVPPPGAVKGVPVGLLLPLSGPEAAVGQSMLDAAQLAVFDVAEPDFVLLPRDTGGTPEGAREAALAAIQDGARLLLGPLFAASVAEITPLARAALVNVIAFSNDRSVASRGTWLIGLLPRTQIERVTRFAASRDLRRFAALVPDTPFGRIVAADLQNAAARFGGAVTQVEVYGPGPSEVNVAVRRLASYEARRDALARQRALLSTLADQQSRIALARLDGLQTLGNLGFDAVLVPESGAQLKSVAPLLPFYDIDIGKVRLLGTADWLEPGLGREPSLVGGWFAGPPPAARAEFETRYGEAYGRPPHPLAALAYDAVALAAVLAAAEGGADFSADALTRDNGFAGVAGIFRLRPDGLVQRGLAVMEVEPNGFRVIDPAPATFDELFN